MRKLLLILVTLFIKFSLTAQVSINQIGGYEIATDLLGQYEVIILANLELINNGRETVEIIISSEGFDIPPSWNANFSAIDAPPIISLAPGQQELIPNEMNVEGIVPDNIGTAYQDLEIRMITQNGSTVEDFRLSYELQLPDRPTPTFDVFDGYSGGEDTIFIMTFPSIPGDSLVPATAFVEINDYWGVRRPLVFNPIDIISQNVSEVVCVQQDVNGDFSNSWCNGDAISLGSDFFNFEMIEFYTQRPGPFRFEVLVQIYDPLDSIASQQTVRLINQSIECESGVFGNILEEEIEQACVGSDVNLDVFGEYQSITWFIESAMVIDTLFGPSVTIENVTDLIQFRIDAVGIDGCNYFYEDFIQPIAIREPIIQSQLLTSPISVEACLGQPIPVFVDPMFTDVQWLTPDGDFTGNSIVVENNTFGNGNISVRATNIDGCQVSWDVNIILLDQTPSNLLPFNVRFVCEGASFNYNLQHPDPDQVRWIVESTGEVIEGNFIFLRDIFQDLIVRLEVNDGTSCPEFQQIQIITEERYTNDLVDFEDFQFCEDQDLVLEANEGFEDVMWIVDQDTTFGPILLITNIADVQGILVSGRESNGCLNQQEFDIELNTEIMDENLVITDFGNEVFCQIVTLEAKEGFEQYEWYLFNLDTGQFELEAQGRIVEIDFRDEPASFVPLMQVRARDIDGCLVGELFEFLPSTAQREDIIDRDVLPVYCEGDSLSLTLKDGLWESIVWFYQGQRIESSTLDIVAGTDNVRVTALKADGCTFFEQFIPEIGSGIESPQLCAVTNDGFNGNNVLLWEDNSSINITEFVIMREGNSTGQFDEIGRISATEARRFEDPDADSQQRPYRYQIRSANSCGELSAPSDIHKTIHLTINQGSSNNINLIWDRYEGIDYDQVRILRGSSLQNLDEYAVLPGNVFSFTDENPLPGDAYYQIELTLEIDCDYERSRFFIKSNVQELLTVSVTDLPTVDFNIRPNPVDEILEVTLAGAGQLSVYNVQGVLVYQENIVGTHRINVRTYEDGIYWVTMVTKEGIQSKKLMIIHN